MDLSNLNKDREKFKRKPTADLSTMVYGKVPPQAKELEEVILGAIMLEKEALDKVSEFLHPECFYMEAHQRIYKAMVGLSSANEPIDLMTVVAALKSAEDLEAVGGPYYIATLTNSVVSAANIVSHAKIVYQLWIKREVIRINGEMIAIAYEDSSDAFELIESMEQQVSQLAIQQTGRRFQTLGEVAKESAERIYQAKQSGDELTGVPSGIASVDALTQGWQRTNFIILAARPGVGKSAVAGNLARNAAEHPDKPTAVAIFSLEMSSGQWADRMLSASTMIPLSNMKRGRVDDQEMAKIQKTAMIDFAKTPIYFDDSPNLSIFQLKRKARILVLKHKVGLILLDYLQLMGGNRKPGENREQEVAGISRELKQLAKELNVPVIALSQLSRQGDNAEPRLSHLRESGAIEQDADDVFFLYPVPEEDQQADMSLKDSLLLIIAKHRNGMLDKLPLKFVKNIQRLMTEQEYERYMTGRNMPGPAGSSRLPYPDEKDLPF
jgi:replicative DNA helicase